MDEADSGNDVRREKAIEYKVMPAERAKPIVSQPLFPHQIMQVASVMCVVIGVVIALAALLPPPLHEPTNEFVTPRFMLPDWYFLWVYGILKWVGWINTLLKEAAWAKAVASMLPFLSSLDPELVGIGLSGLVVMILFALPFVDRGPTARPTERPLKSAVGVAGIILIVFMSLYGVNEIIAERISWGVESTRNLLGVLALGAPLAFGLVTYAALKRLRSGYEYQLNKCYQCEKCSLACPITAIGEIDDLNLVHNTYQNVTDDTWACLTCGHCSTVCPQGLNYEDYILSLREGKECDLVAHKGVFTELTEIMAQVDLGETPLGESDYGYFPGCLEHLAAYMEVGDPFTDIETASMRLLEESGVSPIKLDLKCCGHDQLWQGKREIFESLRDYNTRRIGEYGVKTLVVSCAECFRTFNKNYDLDGVKVVHISEVLTRNMDRLQSAYRKSREPLLVTSHDACRLRQMEIYDEPRMLLRQVDGVELLEMEHSREDARCCGVAAMMNCNDVRMGLVTDRLEQARDTGAKYLVTTCPKCLAHFECMKRAWGEQGETGRYDLKIMDLSVFLAKNLKDGFEPSQEMVPV